MYIYGHTLYADVRIPTWYRVGIQIYMYRDICMCMQACIQTTGCVYVSYVYTLAALLPELTYKSIFSLLWLGWVKF